MADWTTAPLSAPSGRSLGFNPTRTFCAWTEYGSRAVARLISRPILAGLLGLAILGVLGYWLYRVRPYILEALDIYGNELATFPGIGLAAVPIGFLFNLLVRWLSTISPFDHAARLASLFRVDRVGLAHRDRLTVRHLFRRHLAILPVGGHPGARAARLERVVLQPARCARTATAHSRAHAAVSAAGRAAGAGGWHTFLITGGSRVQFANVASGFLYPLLIPYASIGTTMARRRLRRDPIIELQMMTQPVARTDDVELPPATAGW